MLSRQDELLKEIVETYIKDVKPVGSKSLCEKLKCSSATIRNEMVILEDAGLIEKTHSSSGRIPSEAGYRYYVENLMKPKELSGDDILKLQALFRNNELVLSDTITKCMEIISEMTNYTSVVLGKASKDNTLKQVNIIPLGDEKVVTVLVTDHGIVHNKQMIIPSNINLDELVRTSEIINKMLVGTPIDEINSRLEFEIKPEIAKVIKKYDEVTKFFHQTFSDFTVSNSNVFFSGKNNILKQPEYNDPKKIKEIISKFEDEELISKIETHDKEINIFIGEETEFDPDLTIIKTSYKVNDEEGTLAIIGPKRMEYDKVITLMNYIKEQIEERR
ncbi:MAG: heat-inducible transcription repressor HrcA [Mollicutes bacterium]|jgi:heat-inducible transcriptional repressor|nr:heat-inducible transcription repressor HrcA [Mollicutes bacterium]